MLQTDSVIFVANLFNNVQIMEAPILTNDGQIRWNILKLDGVGPIDNRPSPD